MKIIVLDFGGSFIKYGLMEGNHELRMNDKTPTPLDSIDNLYASIDFIIKKLGKADGMAISMPGAIDSDNGIVYTAGALDKILVKGEWASVLEERYGMKVWLGNDAKCAALAEVGYGVLSDVDDSVAIILGTAVGGAIIQNKKVLQGKHFAAGEVSNLRINQDDPYKHSGIWALYGGKFGLRQAYQKEYETSETPSGEEIFELANKGEEKGLNVISQYAKWIAIQLYNIQVIVDAQKIAIGGGVSAQPLLIEKINEEFDKVYNSLNTPIYRLPIVACQYRNDANLIGAYYGWMTKYQK